MCLNRECSQFRREKNVFILKLYGFGYGFGDSKELLTCPECDHVLPPKVAAQELAVNKQEQDNPAAR